MKVECGIFDFDGTLFDSMYVWEHFGEQYLASLGIQAKETIEEDIRTLSQLQSARFLQREYQIPLTVEEILEGFNVMVATVYAQEVLPKPGVVEFLRALQQQGARLCVATASGRHHVEAALERCGMMPLFDRIFTCSEVGHGKDEPHIFRQAMKDLGASRETTVVFEDALHAVETAKTDGFQVAAIFDPSEPGQEALKQISDCYLEDFLHPEPFWKFASAE